MIRLWMLIAAVVAFPASNALAQPAAAAPAAVDDALFAAAAAESGASEVAISRLGAERATDPELKRIGRQLADDHAKVNAELSQLAAAKGIALPREVGPCSQFRLQSLAGLSGQEFDKCFAETQLVIHKDAIAMFKAEAERGRDAEIKALAAKALPKLKEHLEMIKPIAERFEKSDHATLPTNQ